MKRSYYGRKPSREFGGYLRKWREAVPLTLDEAAPRLGLESKNPGAHLSMIERGKRPIPEVALLKIPSVYRVSPEEVLRRAYWPQLPLSLLTAIMEPTALPKAIEDYLRDIENELEENEKKELTRYAALLVLRRHITTEH
jgi:transcriptional regulator with XRE-family HTH domain